MSKMRCKYCGSLCGFYDIGLTFQLLSMIGGMTTMHDYWGYFCMSHLFYQDTPTRAALARNLRRLL